MRKAWTPPTRWVFGVATGLGLFSTLQAIRLTALTSKEGMPLQIGKLLILNLALWYIPALLTPSIVALARRFRLDEGRRLRALVVHVAAALVLRGRAGSSAWSAYAFCCGATAAAGLRG